VAISVTSNLALLAAFKYFNFFTANSWTSVWPWRISAIQAPVWKVALPAGISFYTFQSIGYVVDVIAEHVRGLPEIAGLRTVRLRLSATVSPDRSSEPRICLARFNKTRSITCRNS